MHDDLIRQLDEAVTEVFAVLLNLACEASQPLPDEMRPQQPPALTASVRFSGLLEACCCLQMDPRSATEITSDLTGLPAITITAALSADTAGELCNMIVGCWKKRQPAEGTASQLSCPIVRRGPCHHAPPPFRENLSLRYQVGHHRMTLHVAFN